MFQRTPWVADSYNAFAYVGFDPVNGSDPLGLFWGGFDFDRDAADEAAQALTDATSDALSPIIGPTAASGVASLASSNLGFGGAVALGHLGPDILVGVLNIPGDFETSVKYDSESHSALASGQYENAAWSKALSYLYLLRTSNKTPSCGVIY